MDNVIIRKALKADMPAVHGLIRELAIYEKAEKEHTNTVEQLIIDGFTDNLFNCIVAEVNNKVIGFALYYTSYSTWKGKCMYLEDFLVTKSMRQKGIGDIIFNELICIAKQKKVARFEWQVLDWNAPAIKFYKKFNANLDNTWLNGKLVF